MTSRRLKDVLCAIAFAIFASGLFAVDLRAAPATQPPVVKQQVVMPPVLTPPVVTLPVEPTLAGPPMRFLIVRSAEPACEPRCAEWISAEGRLTPESAAAFRKILAVMGKRKLPILIHSQGGSVESGIAIGRMVRSGQMDVAVSKTELKPCTAPAKECRQGYPAAILRGEAHSRGAMCASACTFILAGAVNRFVAPWSGVGVHQVTAFEKQINRTIFYKTTTIITPGREIISNKIITGEKDVALTYKLDAPTPATVAKIRDFLKEMGISDQLQKIMVETGAKDIRWLTHAELSSTHMATDYYGGEYRVTQSNFMSTPVQITNALAMVQSPYASDAKAEVASVAFGLLKMPSFTDHDVTVSIEFVHRKDAPVVEMSALVEEREGFIPTGNLSLAVEFGTQRQAATATAVSASPLAPLLATIPSSNLCGGRMFNSIFKLTLAQMTPGATISGPPVFFETRNWTLMRELQLDVCKT